MINREILKQLICVTDEEQAILDGRGTVDSSIYTENDGNVISAKKLLKDGKLITVRAHTRFIHFPEHTHDFVEVVYMCSGKTTHIINGKSIELCEGELLFLGQNARQEILPASGNDIAVNFIILPEFFNKTLEMLGAEETPLKRFLTQSLFKQENPRYLHFRVADVLPVQNLVENLLWTLINNTSNKRNINQTTMGLLFMQLLNHTDKLVHFSREEAAVLQIIEYIEKNYRNASLTEASKLLHYDFYRLSHEIKNQTGKTYTELLQDKRLSQAAYLLKNTKIGIDEISAAVGYENKSYFHRIFAKHFGKSPKKYRDSCISRLNLI